MAIIVRASLYGFNYDSLFSDIEHSIIQSVARNYYEGLIERFGVIIAMVVSFMIIRIPLIPVDYYLLKLTRLKDLLQPAIEDINKAHATHSPKMLETHRLFTANKYKPFYFLPLFILKFAIPIILYFNVYRYYAIDSQNAALQYFIALVAIAALGYTNYQHYVRASSKYMKSTHIASFVVISILALFAMPTHLLLFILLMQLSNVLSEATLNSLSNVSDNLEKKENARQI